MKTIIAALLVLVAALTPQLLAQSTLEPTLGQIFPVKLEGERLVVPYAVLLNLNDILPAGTAIHKLIQRPRQDDKDVKKRKNMDFNTDKYAAVQRFAVEHREIDPNKSAVTLAVEDRAKGPSMTDEMKFRAYLHRAVTEDYYLAYDLPSGGERRIGQFEFPEGLFLAEKDGGVVVLAVGKGSMAERKGVLVGSVLKALNGIPLKSLEDFRDRFFKEKTSKQQVGESVIMTILYAGQKQNTEVDFSSGRSLKSAGDLMSDLSAEMEPKNQSAKPTPTPARKEPVTKMPIL
ncbi:MAG: PDZ domain-containing protein [Blastochloris sp.]|nr:PDZ domain-containing protein [Blastochloris sp.]